MDPMGLFAIFRATSISLIERSIARTAVALSSPGPEDARKISALKREGWFDLKQGSIATRCVVPSFCWEMDVADFSMKSSTKNCPANLYPYCIYHNIIQYPYDNITQICLINVYIHDSESV
jgi:hypothetical protein